MYRAALNDADSPLSTGSPSAGSSGLRAGGPPRIHGADLTRILLEGIRNRDHFFFRLDGRDPGLLRSFLTESTPAWTWPGTYPLPSGSRRSESPREMIESLNSSARTSSGSPWAPESRSCGPTSTGPAEISRSSHASETVFEIFAAGFPGRPVAAARGAGMGLAPGPDPWPALDGAISPRNGRFLVLLGSRWLRRR